tara:strand:- start:91 stop:603 length:513 start_codon:yes stop_codon:yes gene_type:complete
MQHVYVFYLFIGKKYLISIKETVMFKTILYILIFFSLVIASERQNIVDVLESYNEAFGNSNYSDIVNYFDYPTSFNLQDKTIGASGRFKLKLIYKKIRGDLPDYYSYSKWDEIDIQLIDDSIAIVNAKFSRYKNDDTIYDSGAAQYHMRLVKNEWKIFSLTPYVTIETLD